MSANLAVPTVLTSEDGLVAELTAVEFGRSLSVLRGGNESWATSGRELTNDHGDNISARAMTVGSPHQSGPATKSATLLTISVGKTN